MGYTLNLSDISLMDYQGLLRQQNLLPGRRMLLEELDARFAAFADLGLTTVAQLKASLATPQKMASLVQKTGIPEEYLVILRRELGSLTQKPVSLVEFRDCDPSRIDSLAAIGIRTSQTLWEWEAMPPPSCLLFAISSASTALARLRHARFTKQVMSQSAPLPKQTPQTCWHALTRSTLKRVITKHGSVEKICNSASTTQSCWKSTVDSVTEV